jgi:hypothetical protein
VFHNSAYYSAYYSAAYYSAGHNYGSFIEKKKFVFILKKQVFITKTRFLKIIGQRLP